MKKTNWILSLVVIAAILAFGSYLVNKDVTREVGESEQTVAEQVKEYTSEKVRTEVKGTENLLTKTEAQGGGNGSDNLTSRTE
jgi:hypothetical protein